MLEAGSKINEDNISILKEMKVKEVELIEFPKGKDNPILINALEKMGSTTMRMRSSSSILSCVKVSLPRSKTRRLN